MRALPRAPTPESKLRITTAASAGDSGAFTKITTLYSPRYASHEPTTQSEITSLLPMYKDLESSLSVSLLRMPNKYASPGVYSRLVNS